MVSTMLAVPLHLTWYLRMPPGEIIALLLLFARGVLCIFIATLRAAVITANTIKTGGTIDGTRLAVWRMIEFAVGMSTYTSLRTALSVNISPAVVIGLCPAFAVLIRGITKTKKSSNNVNGYGKHDSQSFSLQNPGISSTHSNNKRLDSQDADAIWLDEHRSQEKLARMNDEISSVRTIRHRAGSPAVAQ